MTRRRMTTVATLALATNAWAADADDFPIATPESQGMSSAALAELADVVRGYHERGLIVGAELVVIKNRHIVLHEMVGWRDSDDKEPWTDETVCNIRSMTKPITGAAVQILIDRGKLALDDPVAQHLSGFDTDESRAITVEQLLTHRSGLPLTILTTSIDQFDTLLDQGNAAGLGGPEFEPGSKFWYSDAASDALGALVEAVSGESLDVFVTREILEPLGMTDTVFLTRTTDVPAGYLERAASLYVGSGRAWTRFWPADEPFYPFPWGSQSLYGTPEDYARFLAMWMDRGATADGARVLSEEAVARTLTPVSPMTMLGSDARFPTSFLDLEVAYGQMSVLHVPVSDPTDGPVIIGHSGSDGTIAWAWPNDDLMIVYFTQSRGGTTALRLEESIEPLLLHPDRVQAQEPVPDELQPFIGTYIANFASFENEPFEVLYRNGHLVLDIPSQMVFELNEPDAEGRRSFAITDAVSVSFERDEAGAVVLLKLHQAGMVFEVPREGTALAEAMARPTIIDPEVAARLLGTYTDEDADGAVEVILDGEQLCLKAPPGLTFHLRPTEDDLVWLVRQIPGATLTFEADADGNIVSLVRDIGGERVVMPKRDDETGD